MNVAVIGLGKLGSAMAAVYASVGHTVYGYDTDEALLERLRSGQFQTDEPQVSVLLRQHADRLHYPALTAEAVFPAALVFVIVPTPSQDDGRFDSAQVVTACCRIGAALYQKPGYTLVVIVSTLMPGQMESDVIPALEQASEKSSGVDFGVCYSPEFIALGRIVEGLRQPDYVLIGSRNGADALQLKAFYETVTSAPAQCVNLVNAELAKLATNAYLSLKIAYANMLGQICERLPGAQVDEVTTAVGMDHRIGGAYLRAGLPAGGVCLPRDLVALNTITDGYQTELIQMLPTVNEQHINNLSSRIISICGENHYTALVLGTNYSLSAPLEDQSPGLEIVRYLQYWNISVRTERDFTSRQAGVDAVDVVVLALPLPMYIQLHFHAGQHIFDLWRVLDPQNVPAGVKLWQFGVGAKVGQLE